MSIALLLERRRLIAKEGSSETTSSEPSMSKMVPRGKKRKSFCKDLFFLTRLDKLFRKTRHSRRILLRDCESMGERFLLRLVSKSHRQRLLPNQNWLCTYSWSRDSPLDDVDIVSLLLRGHEFSIVTKRGLVKRYFQQNFPKNRLLFKRIELKSFAILIDEKQSKRDLSVGDGLETYINLHFSQSIQVFSFTSCYQEDIET